MQLVKKISINSKIEEKIKSKTFQTHSYYAFVLMMLIIICAVIILPFVWMLAIAFDAKTVTNIPFPPRIIPEQFSLRNFNSAIVNMKLWVVYKNSMIIAGGSVIVSVFTSLLAGYSMSKVKFKGWKVVLIICLATVMIPPEATIISIFLTFSKMGLTNTYTAFFLLSASFPLGVFLAKQYFDTLPDSLREAALIDGAGEFRIFIKIFMPLAGAMTATIAILRFLAMWNNLLMPLILISKPKMFTMQIGLAMFRNAMKTTAEGAGGQSYPGVMMAGNVLSILPVLFIYLFLQRYIIQSVAMSGIKQ